MLIPRRDPIPREKPLSQFNSSIGKRDARDDDDDDASREPISPLWVFVPALTFSQIILGNRRKRSSINFLEGS